MPNNVNASEPITSDDAPLHLQVVPRPSKIVEGHTLILCVCKVPIEIRFTMLEATNREKPESPWLPGETCACGGTGWVCVGCHGHQWALQINREKHRSEAVPCGICSETKSCAVVWQPWMLKFRNAKAPQAVPVRRIDAAAEQAERERREAERAAKMVRIADEQVMWDDLYAREPA